jgi:hypothetical protein
MHESLIYFFKNKNNKKIVRYFYTIVKDC